MKLNFDDKKFVLVVQRLILRNIGFWPGDDNIKKWQIVFAIFAVIELSMFAVFHFSYCLANIEDLAEFLRIFLSAVVHLIISLKFLVIIWKRKDFKRIIDFILKAFVEGKHQMIFSNHFIS